jgi:hypothetical protein
MADSVRWVSSAEEQLGWLPGTFLRAFEENNAKAAEIPLENPVAVLLTDKLLLPWVGTCTELLERLETIADEKTQRRRKWPRSPDQLGNELRRLAPHFRTAGLAVEFDRKGRDKKRRRVVAITSLMKVGTKWLVSPVSASM